MIDPLATLTPPDPYVVGTSPHSGGTAAGPKTKTLVSGDYVLRPGAYWGGIAIKSNANVTFLPGIYVMAGGGFAVTGSGVIIGDGVFIYNTFDPENLSGDGDCKSVNLRGSADFFLTAPSDGDYADILFWQDVSCDAPFKHEGSGDFTGGIIYVPGALIDLAGSGNMGTVQVIGDTVTVTGTADLIINYGGFLDAPLPDSYRLIE